MKAEDVIKQLYAKLPQQTEIFSDILDVVSITSTALVATVTTTAKHFLSTGDQVTITGAKTQTPVTIARTGTTLSLVSTVDHDLTLSPIDPPQFVTIEGATEPEFNGTFRLTKVLNRKAFNLLTVDSGPTLATGSPIALDIAGAEYNGLKTVTVVDDVTFTYVLPADLISPALGTPRVHKGVRVTGSISADRIVDTYTATPPDDLWAFVVLSDVVASKDRNILNDATATQTANTFKRQQVIQGFSVFVIAPASDELQARAARDKMEDVAVYLFGSLLGISFDTQFFNSQKWVVTFAGHSFELYNGSIYMHEFIFDQLADVLFEDSAVDDDSRAFRDIDVTFRNTVGSEAYTATIDLDEQPL